MQTSGSAILAIVIIALVVGASIGTMYGLTHPSQVGRALTDSREFGNRLSANRTRSASTASAVASIPAVLGGVVGGIASLFVLQINTTQRRPITRLALGAISGLVGGAVGGAAVTTLVPQLIAEGAVLGAIVGGFTGMVSLSGQSYTPVN